MAERQRQDPANEYHSGGFTQVRANGLPRHRRVFQGQWCRRASLAAPAGYNLPRLRGIQGQGLLHQRDERCNASTVSLGHVPPLIDIRWVLQCNPQLAALITHTLGNEQWLLNAKLLANLLPMADNKQFRQAFRDIKQDNKKRVSTPQSPLELAKRA